MAKAPNKSRTTKGSSPDPYLRAFLRQAIAIITVEKGLNENSQSKLQILANQLGLSKETFQKALQQLKQPDNSHGLNRYEKKFVERLTREFEKISGKVLNIRSERLLLDLAESRFQIDAIRAHQLIQKIAQQFNVGTISHADAEQFAQQLIEDKVGTQIVLPRIDVDRLCKTCEKWGLDNERAEQIIRASCSRNRWARRMSLVRLCSFAILAVVLLGSGVMVFNQVDWEKVFTPNQPIAKHANKLANDIPYPPWWDSKMIAASQSVAQRGKRQLTQMERLIEADAEKTGRIYEELIEEKLDRSQLDLQLARLIAAAHANDPDQSNANSILSTIENWIGLPANFPATASQIRKSANATHLFSILLYDAKSRKESGQNQRYSQLKNFNDKYFSIGEEVLLESYYDMAIENLTNDQWAHALRFCEEQPKAVASFLHELETRNTSNPSAINEIRTRVVQNILTIEPSLWRTCKNSITTSIFESNPVLQDSWVQFSANTSNAALNEHINEQLSTPNPSILTGNPQTSTTTAALSSHKQNHLQVLQTRQKIEIHLLELKNKINAAGVRAGGNSTRQSVNRSNLLNLTMRIAKTNNLLLFWHHFRDGPGTLEEVNILLDKSGDDSVPSVEDKAARKPTA